MYKTKITEKQAEAIEHLTSRFEREEIVKHHVKSNWNQEKTKSLNDLPLDDLIIAIYCEYTEV